MRVILICIYLDENDSYSYGGEGVVVLCNICGSLSPTRKGKLAFYWKARTRLENRGSVKYRRSKAVVDILMVLRIPDLGWVSFIVQS